MESADNEILDDLRANKDPFGAMPPAVVRFEQVFFIVWNLLIYCCILMDHLGLMLALMMHFGIGCWQLVSALICNGIYKSPARALYNKLLLGYIAAAALCVVYIIAFTYYEVDTISYLYFGGLILLPHALDWLYWYVAHTESKIRQQMLHERTAQIEQDWLDDEAQRFDNQR